MELLEGGDLQSYPRGQSLPDLQWVDVLGEQQTLFSPAVFCILHFDFGGGNTGAAAMGVLPAHRTLGRSVLCASPGSAFRPLPR